MKKISLSNKIDSYFLDKMEFYFKLYKKELKSSMGDSDMYGFVIATLKDTHRQVLEIVKDYGKKGISN